jgi:hypothetical protein
LYPFLIRPLDVRPLHERFFFALHLLAILNTSWVGCVPAHNEAQRNDAGSYDDGDICVDSGGGTAYDNAYS